VTEFGKAFVVEGSRIDFLRKGGVPTPPQKPIEPTIRRPEIEG
jgi:hypothetical protein